MRSFICHKYRKVPQHWRTNHPNISTIHFWEQTPIFETFSILVVQSSAIWLKIRNLRKSGKSAYLFEESALHALRRQRINGRSTFDFGCTPSFSNWRTRERERERDDDDDDAEEGAGKNRGWSDEWPAGFKLPPALLSDEQTCRGCSLSRFTRYARRSGREDVASLQRAPSPPPTHPGRTRRFLNSIYFARSFSFVRSPRAFPCFPSDFLPPPPTTVSLTLSLSDPSRGTQSVLGSLSFSLFLSLSRSWSRSRKRYPWKFTERRVRTNNRN